MHFGRAFSSSYVSSIENEARDRGAFPALGVASVKPSVHRATAANVASTRTLPGRGHGSPRAEGPVCVRRYRAVRRSRTQV